MTEREEEILTISSLVQTEFLL